MRLPISSRLLACAEFIAPGDRVADIGCDHGYLGIYLLQNKIATHGRERGTFRVHRKSRKMAEKQQLTNQIIKWETSSWGEIPADFGRK